MNTFARHRILLSRSFVLILVLCLLFSGGYWDHIRLPLGDFLVSLGLILISMAAIGRLWCNLYIVGYKNSQLLMVGPYSISRNPLYFFSSLGAVGFGLVSESLVVTLVIAGVFAIVYPRVIRSEENYLASIHGEKWLAYIQRVPRFWPRLKQLQEPNEYMVYPLQFRRHLLDALWFVWAAAILLFFETLRDYHYFPTFWYLP